LTHSYVAVTELAVRNAALGAFPNPAAFPLQVRPVLRDFVHVGVPMKWGLSAKAAETERTSISIASNTAIANRRIVDLLLKYNVNTVKKCAHAHYWFSTHSKASIQRGLFHALRGPYPKEIVSSTTQDILHHMHEGVISSIAQNIFILYICVFVKLIFDFLRHYYYV